MMGSGQPPPGSAGGGALAFFGMDVAVL